MKLLSSLIFVLLVACTSVFAQYKQQYGNRVAPGVPPQHYQPPSASPGVNTQNQQQYQPQQPQGNVPQAQQQHDVRQPPERPTAPVGGSGYAHTRTQGQIFDTSNIDHERQHIKEHMNIPIDTSQMSQDELMFHNFKMWDADKDDVVDGLDLVKYLMSHLGGEDSNFPPSYTDLEFGEIADQLLTNMDVNKDGIATFSEYMSSSKPHG